MAESSVSMPPRKAGDSGTLTIVVDGVEDVVSRDGLRHRFAQPGRITLTP